jgi:hypothetical protein
MLATAMNYEIIRADTYILSGCELIDSENISLPKKTMNITIKEKIQQS